MTPEVVNVHFSSANRGSFFAAGFDKKKKTSRKRLVFNDFHSGGRLRTSDLRVMSAFEVSRAIDNFDGSYGKTVGLRPRRMGCDVTPVLPRSSRNGVQRGVQIPA